MARPPKYPVALTEDQRQELAGMFRAGTYTATIFRRMRILQALDRGKMYAEIEDEIDCSRATITKVAKTFCEQGFEAVFRDKPRSGRPKKIGPKAESVLVELVASEPPKGRARWTLELLTDELERLGLAEEVSPKTVGRVLKKTSSPLGW